MPGAWIKQSDAGVIRVAGSHDLTYDLINDARFQDADKAKVALVLKELVQAELETVMRLRDLPDDEPTKTTDPAPQFGERFFWRGRGANKELVSRDTIVEACVWDGERFVFTMRYARGPS